MPTADYINVPGTLDSENEGCVLVRKVQAFRGAPPNGTLVTTTETGDTYHFIPDVVIQPRPADGTQFCLVAPQRKLSKRKVCKEGVSNVVTVS